jgi:ATP-dependent DNA helicase RecG
MNLTTSIEKIPGIGPAYQKKLKRLGIKTIQDLLFHFPHRYEDFSNIISIAGIKLNENCSVWGKILEIKNNRTWKKKMILTKAVIQDSTGAVGAIWFNQPYLLNVLKEGEIVALSGKAVLGKNGLYLSNPAYEKINPRTPDLRTMHTGRIVPVYPETEGLSSRWLRSILKPLLIKFKDALPDPLPEEVRKEEGLLPLKKAIWQVHFPDSLELAKKAKERFSFEELFFIQLWVLKERMRLAKEKALAIPLNLELMQEFVKKLPFKLTDAQKKSAWQILKDLEKTRPMNRLLEGEVGSGKTVVAAMAALNVIRAGWQVALMAPTEILAKQHFKTVWEMLSDFKIDIGLLTGKSDKFFSKKLKNQSIEISRKKLLEKTERGEIDFLIGTHALIQDRVKFGKLALVILDEQHRFGVEQRARLCSAKALAFADRQPAIPHLLSMTATPIPRTLALTIYGDLDLSLIDQLPRGRKKIKTSVIPPEDRKKAYNFIKKEIKRGRQAFVICPRIEKSETPNTKLETNSGPQTPNKKNLGWSEVKAVKEEYERLSKEVFPDLKVGMLHGKMPGLEKEKIMQDFKNKKIDILVSTSVVEVGVDIPNATIMMIEGTERFGLAQLYQFRGRVGRSKYQSYCFLFTESPAKKTHQRLKALITCENGFELAEKDLQIRGPGDFAGKRQWGIPDMVMDSLKDIHLVEKTRECAKEILIEDPYFKKYPSLKAKLEKMKKIIHLE